jgi:hypothetical protein
MGAAALAALLGLGCGSVLRSASYTGTSLPVIVSAANVTTADGNRSRGLVAKVPYVITDDHT